MFDKAEYVIETLKDSYKVRDINGNTIGCFYKGKREGKMLFRFERTDRTGLGCIDGVKHGETPIGRYEIYDAQKKGARHHKDAGNSKKLAWMAVLSRADSRNHAGDCRHWVSFAYS